MRDTELGFILFSRSAARFNKFAVAGDDAFDVLFSRSQHDRCCSIA